MNISPEEALNFVQTRDRRDIEREHAPLSVATDALIIDSSTRSVEEVVNDLIAIIHAVK
jgi:cytidylate kinase